MSFYQCRVLKLFLMTLALMVFVTRHASADILIGYTGPLSGSDAIQKEDEERGAAQAIKDINDRGDTYGQKLVLYSESDVCDIRQTAAIDNRFVANQVKFVVGAACPASTLVSAKFFNAQNILMISPNTTDPTLTSSGYKTIFRLSGRSDQQGIVQAQYVIKNFRNYRIAVLHDGSSEAYAQAAMFQKTLNAAGVKEVLFDSYAPQGKDYSALISKLNNQNGIQFLVIDGSYKDVAIIAQAIKSQKANIQIMGNNSLANDKFYKLAGDASEGVLLTYEANAPGQNEAQNSQNGTSTYSLYSYAAVQLIAESIKQAGYADSMKAAMALRKNSFDTILGNISFDENGDILQSGYAIYRWHGGGYKAIGG